MTRHRTAGLAVALAVAAAAALAAPPADDVYMLRNGDRITGHTVSTANRIYVVQTPFGRLTIPRSRVHKVLHANGREELVNRLQAADTRSGRPARLVLIVTGQTFWQAWDPKQKPEPDPRLRMAVTLDEDPVAIYVDGTPDPGEIKGALVNAFSFLPGEVKVETADGVLVQPAEARPGRIALRLDLPGSQAGERKLRVAYQANTGTPDDPSWKDLATGDASIFLQAGEPTFLQIRQERGSMEYSGFPRKRMKNVETFGLEIAPE